MGNKELKEDAVVTPRTLCEVQESVLQIVEGSEKTGKVRVKGEFARSDTATQNGRVYTRTLWEREIQRMARNLSSRKVLGELDHPQDGRTQLARVSHVITNLSIDENGVVIGEAEIVDTAKGRDLQALLKSGCKIGVSSRGHGSTHPTEDGHEQVMEDYQLNTFDFVGDPADQSAYPAAFFESKERRMATKAKEDGPADTTFTQEEVQALVAERVSEATLATEETLRDQYASKLPALVEKITVETREAVSAELLSDPNIAGAKQALEGVKEFLRPYVLPEDAAKVVAGLETKVSDLAKEVKERDLQIEQLQTENQELETVTRATGYRYFLERRLQESPEGELIRAAVGDVDAYESLDSLKTKVDDVESELGARREQEQAMTEAHDKEVAALVSAERQKWQQDLETSQGLHEASTEHQKDLESTVVQLKEGLEKALLANKLQSARLYAEAKISGHPGASEIRRVIGQASDLDEAQVDTIIESFKDATRSAPSVSSGGDMEKLRSRVRQLTRGGQGPTAVSEEVASGPVSQADYNDIGQSLQNIRRLSGLSGN